MDRNSILSLLKEGDMTYADFRAKGHYPRKELGLLQDSDIVEKVIIGGKIRWHLKEQFGDKEMTEITEGLNKAINLMEEYLPEDTKKITIETETKDNVTHREVTFELEKPVVPPKISASELGESYFPESVVDIAPSVEPITITNENVNPTDLLGKGVIVNAENQYEVADTSTQVDGILIKTTENKIIGDITVTEVEEPKKKKWFWQK